MSDGNTPYNYLEDFTDNEEERRDRENERCEHEDD